MNICLNCRLPIVTGPWVVVGWSRRGQNIAGRVSVMSEGTQEQCEAAARELQIRGGAAHACSAESIETCKCPTRGTS